MAKMKRREFCAGISAVTLSAGIQSACGELLSETKGTSMAQPRKIIGDFKFIDFFCGIGGFYD